MKKSVISPLVFALLIAIISANFSSGILVTGNAVNQPTNVSIFIAQNLPFLQINSPHNETYLKNDSIYLNYQARYTNNLWYNLDGANNITLAQPIYLNLASGSHIIFVYANSSVGTAIKNISFYVNTTLFAVHYGKYNGSSSGNSTNFYLYSYEELQNLSNICLENTNYGKICFNEPINVTADFNPHDGILELDTNTRIQSGLLELNSQALPNFDKRATLWIYGLNFSNPRIRKDGVLCVSPACIKESFSAGTLKFNVTGFSAYTAEETPVSGTTGETITTQTISGGGGGSCYTGWACTEWSDCINEKQARACKKEKDSCIAEDSKPIEERDCKIEQEKPLGKLPQILSEWRFLLLIIAVLVVLIIASLVRHIPEWASKETVSKE